MGQNGKRCLFSVLVPLGLAAALFASLRVQSYPEHHPGIDDGQPVGLVGAAPRSSKWPAVRAAYLRGHPVCEACGAKSDLEVHHVTAFHDDPAKELDPTNFIVLCREDHLRLGHRCDDGHSNWGKCANPNVRADAARELIRRFGPK